MGEKEMAILDKVMLWLKEPSTARGLIVGFNILLKLGWQEYTIEAMFLVIGSLVSLHETLRKESER